MSLSLQYILIRNCHLSEIHKSFIAHVTSLETTPKDYNDAIILLVAETMHMRLHNTFMWYLAQ